MRLAFDPSTGSATFTLKQFMHDILLRAFLPLLPRVRIEAESQASVRQTWRKALEGKGYR